MTLWRRPTVGMWMAAVVVAALMMVSALVLLIWNSFPQLFPPNAHITLAAIPLVLAAGSAVLYQMARRPRPLEVFKVAVVAAAFLSWAVNQALGNSPRALIFNDLAIALFALDVFLSVVFWPPRRRTGTVSASSANE
jgi:thiol:disulfide interchange protein